MFNKSLFGVVKEKLGKKQLEIVNILNSFVMHNTFEQFGYKEKHRNWQ